MHLLNNLHFEVVFTHRPCISSRPSAKDCPFVILKDMGSWKSKLSMQIKLIFPLVAPRDKSAFLHAGMLGRLTLSWTLVRVAELEEEQISFPNLVIHKRNEHKNTYEKACKTSRCEKVGVYQIVFSLLSDMVCHKKKLSRVD